MELMKSWQQKLAESIAKQIWTGSDYQTNLHKNIQLIEVAINQAILISQSSPKQKG